MSLRSPVRIWPESLVGLCLGRSLEMIIGIFGILKSGAAYLPLDPVYPTERLAAMARDAALRHVLTTTESVSALPKDVNALFLDTREIAALLAGEPVGNLTNIDRISRPPASNGSTI